MPPAFPLTKEEYVSLDALFSHFLFQESGAYTLFGDKPISFVTLSEVSGAEKEEFFSNQSSHVIFKNNLNFKENWETWERIKEKFSIPRYLFIKRKGPTFSSKEDAIFLVNIIETASILNKYYDLFRKTVEMHFDPIDIVFEIENNESFFWNKVLSDHMLVGILLGFGEANGLFFEWVVKHEEGEIQIDKKAFLKSLEEQTPGSNSIASSRDLFFPLPSFLSYSESQSLKLIKKYEQERNKIRKIFKRKNLVNISLMRLTSKDLPSDPDENYRLWLGKKLQIKNLSK